MKGGILVAGTTSNAGKSALTTGLCRVLARRGVAVAPFKAQNMTLNTAVTADGGEIGRSQAVQATAARCEAISAMNPVLLRPATDTRSRVVVRGQVRAESGAMDYAELTTMLRAEVADALAELRSHFDVVVCEGAGSPAEINLRDRDITNMWLARHADFPVVTVADVDRGGALAALFGTLALLDPADQQHCAGFVVNKFRGDVRVLQPGLATLSQRTGRRIFGVLPHLDGLWLDGEDSLDDAARPTHTAPSDSADELRIAVVRPPRPVNLTDLDPLVCEPGVSVILTTNPADVADADLVLLPGTADPIGAMGQLVDTGLAEAIRRRAKDGRPVVAVGGGFELLTATVGDGIRCGDAAIAGLGLLPVTIRHDRDRAATLPCGVAAGATVEGQQSLRAAIRVDGGEEFLGGCHLGSVWGSPWHSIFEADDFRRSFLTVVASRAGRTFTVCPNTAMATIRETRIDRLADQIEAHLDIGAIEALIVGGVPGDLPVVTSSLGWRR